MTFDDEPRYPSLTPSAVQIRWKVPTAFPECPTAVTENGLKRYEEQLDFGLVFSDNDYSTSIVIHYQLAASGLVVLTRFVGEAIKDWAVTHVSIRDGLFHHRNEHTFYELKGALKHFCELTGERYDDGIDDHA